MHTSVVDQEIRLILWDQNVCLQSCLQKHATRPYKRTEYTPSHSTSLNLLKLSGYVMHQQV